MTLADHMKANGLDQGQMAARLGVTQSCVSRILKRGSASPQVALAVEAETAGKINAETLCPHIALIRRAPKPRARKAA